MYSFLQSVPCDELLKLINSELKGTVAKLQNTDRDQLYKILFALYGYDILSNARVRERMLVNSSDEEFQIFKNEFSLNHGKRGDSVIALTIQRWAYGSKIVKIFKKVFKVSPSFLPSKTEASSKLETVSFSKHLNPLFDYQEEISSDILEFIDSSDKACIIQMPTGSGKTRTSLDAIVKKMRNDDDFSVIWLAHSSELLEQTIDSFKDIWANNGNRSINIGRLWGSVKPDDELLDTDFLFIGFMKLISIHKSNPDFYQEIINKYKFIVVDEAHKSVSSSLGSVLNNYLRSEETRLMGLTATPGRSVEQFNENKKLVKLYQRIISSEILGKKPIRYLQERGILSKIVPLDYVNGVNIDINPSELDKVSDKGDITAKILADLAKNSQRNEILINTIKNENELGNKVIVFCCNVQHSRHLAVLLAREGILSASVDYTIKPNARKKIIDDFKSGEIKILLNYGIFSTGLDVPDIDTVFITRPTSSIVLYSQMIGRGLRGPNVGGTEECRLINVKDNFKNFGDVDEVYNYFETSWS